MELWLMSLMNNNSNIFISPYFLDWSIFRMLNMNGSEDNNLSPSFLFISMSDSYLAYDDMSPLWQVFAQVLWRVFWVGWGFFFCTFKNDIWLQLLKWVMLSVPVWERKHSKTNVSLKISNIGSPQVKNAMKTVITALSHASS